MPIVTHDAKSIPRIVHRLIQEGYTGITITGIAGSWYIYASKFKQRDFSTNP